MTKRRTGLGDAVTTRYETVPGPNGPVLVEHIVVEAEGPAPLALEDRGAERVWYDPPSDPWRHERVRR